MHKIFRPFNLDGLPCRLADAFLQKNGEVGVIVSFKVGKRYIKVSGWIDKGVKKGKPYRYTVVDTEAVPGFVKQDVYDVVSTFLDMAAETFGGNTK